MFRKNSISARFNIALVLIIAVLMAVFAFVAASVTSQRILSELDLKLTSYLRISSTSLEAPLWNFDNVIVEGYLDSLMLDDAVVFASIESGDGSIVQRTRPDVEGIDFTTLLNSEEFTAGSTDVMRGSAKIGSVDLALSRAAVREEIVNNNYAIVALALLILATISVASILITRAYIARPLEDLQRSAIAIGGGDLDADIETSGKDEIGALARRFDDMRNSISSLVSDLNRSNTKLEDANQTLEERVRQRTKEVMTAQQKLVDAIECTSEGFAFFDADDLLVLHNAQYKRMLYGGSDIDIAPGMSFEHILRAGVDQGLIAVEKESEEAFVETRIKQHRNPGEPILQKRGSDFWLQISERKTSDGGTVSVFSDVSDLKNREADLTEKTKALEHLSSQLAKYLSPQVYDSIFRGEQDVVVASSRKKLTVFFSDIVGFTETAEQMEAEELTAVLNNYLTEMSKIALAHGATIDKYIGDAILAFFGDPDTKGVKQDALACVNMAIAMSARLAELREQWHDSGILWPLEVRMGIHTDYCTVGNFGSERRMDYTIIGRGVNAAARLQSSADTGKILMSYATYAQVKDKVPCVPKGQVEVKGITNPLDVYEVAVGRARGVSRPMQDILARTDGELGLDALTLPEMEKFEQILSQILSQIQDIKSESSGGPAQATAKPQRDS